MVVMLGKACALQKDSRLVVLIGIGFCGDVAELVGVV